MAVDRRSEGTDDGRGGGPEPTADELLAMAYADGELSGPARAAFEARMAREPSLAREVAEVRALEVLARRLAPPEPADFEWRRLEADPLHRGSTGLGWVALTFGCLGLALLACWRVLSSDAISALERGFLASALLGVLLLFVATLRGRLRTLALDPYRNVER